MLQQAHSNILSIIPKKALSHHHPLHRATARARTSSYLSLSPPHSNSSSDLTRILPSSFSTLALISNHYKHTHSHSHVTHHLRSHSSHLKLTTSYTSHPNHHRSTCCTPLHQRSIHTTTPHLTYIPLPSYQHHRTFATAKAKPASSTKKDATTTPQSSPTPSTRADRDNRQGQSGVTSKLSILNQPFPPNRQIAIGLRSIYGIGHSVSHDICGILGLNPFSRVSDLSTLGFEALKRYVERRFQPRHLAIKEEGANIMAKIKLGTYQGMRHSLALPVHGQRTRSNAKTQRKLGRARASLYGYPLLIKKASIVNKSLLQANATAQQIKAAKEGEKRKAAAAAAAASKKKK